MGLGRGGGGRGRGETHLFPYYWETEFLWLCQIYILQGLSEGKWVNLYQIEKIQ